jgi:hypothetical protein
MKNVRLIWILLAMQLLFGCGKDEAATKRVNRIKQDLPFGTTMEKVDLYLANQGIPHSYYTNENKVHTIFFDNLPMRKTEVLSVTFCFDLSNHLTNIESMVEDQIP